MWSLNDRFKWIGYLGRRTLGKPKTQVHTSKLGHPQDTRIAERFLAWLGRTDFLERGEARENQRRASEGGPYKSGHNEVSGVEALRLHLGLDYFVTIV
jgi:hypothetical protein